MIKDPILRRFISKIDMRSDDECWPWLANKDRYNYGHFQLFGKWELAHRISYFIRHGSLPQRNIQGEELLVCHSCDNPFCVNPNHLFLGTHKDNHRDSAAKGRRADRKGSKNPGARLNESQVIKIRLLAANKIPYKKITEIFGISKTTISEIVTGKAWKHI